MYNITTYIQRLKDTLGKPLTCYFLNILKPLNILMALTRFLYKNDFKNLMQLIMTFLIIVVVVVISYRKKLKKEGGGWSGSNLFSMNIKGQ